MNRRGLGRGLGSLLGEERAPRGLTDLPVGRIFPNATQPRTRFAPEAMSDLETSIRELGVLVPLIVRPKGSDFELIAGERRWRAATAIGLPTVPAIVRDADDRESLELAIVENLQRADLDPLEEAMGFSHLIETYGLTQDRVAERVGRSRPSVANALRLLTLSDSIKAYVRTGTLSAGHARALLGIPEAQRERAAERAAHSGSSVRSIEALGRERRPRAKRRRAGADADTDAVIDRLRVRFGAPVAVRRGARGGTIEVRFADEDDLMRIVDVLLAQR